MFLDTAAQVQQRSRVPGSTWACGKGAKPAARSKGLTARREGVGALGPGAHRAVGLLFRIRYFILRLNVCVQERGRGNEHFLPTITH